ncbi:MAG: fibronectin type III domain-containing protein [Clostridia bacterium]|nr:fibronectin type III domain-containing protein [Clostridia bacterium]
MKKIISFVLVFVMAFSMVVIQQTMTFASNDVSTAKITNLKITTVNKKKLLKLTWDQQTNCDGYQIFRSTTGKSGSYKKIATLRSKSVYVDKGLKDAKTYYYAVRAFCKTNGQVSFGKFSKVNLSTRLTKGFLQKKLEKANRLNIGWIAHGEEAYDAYDWNDTKPIPGEDSEWLKYVRVKSTKYKSVSELKKAASSCFIKSLYSETIDSLYADIDGKLYRKSYDVGGDGGDEKAVLKIVSLTNTSCKFKVIEQSDYGMTCLYKLIYRGGNWLFTELMDDYGLYYYGSSYWK